MTTNLLLTILQTQMLMDYSGFSRVEYMTIFVALLYAFSVAEFFFGWGKMIRLSEQLTFSFQHIYLSFVFFWLLMINWYSLWVRIGYLDKGYIYLVVTILPIMFIYLASIFLFPDLEKNNDLKVYYNKNWYKIVICMSIFVLANVGIEYWLHTFEMSPILYFRIFNPLLMLLAGIFRIQWLKIPILVLFTLGMIGGTIHFALI